MNILYLGVILVLMLLSRSFPIENQANAMWVPLSSQELLEQSKTIFVGNVTAVIPVSVQYHSQFERNGTMKQSVGPETMTLDEYTVHVEEFLKNQQDYDTIKLRQATVGGVPSGPSTIGGFKIGDRVLFYLPKYENQTYFAMQYLPESFKIPQNCEGKNVLTQKRPDGGSNFTVIQNGIKIDYGNFTANKPIKFLYDKDMNTLSGKSFDVQVGITKAGNTEPVFIQNIHTDSKPCQWVASVEWDFTPQEGNYRMVVNTKEGGIVTGTSDTGFSVKSDTMSPNQVSPLKQFKSGIAAKDVKCETGLELLMKSHDNMPACVKSTSTQRLLEQGWINPYDFNGKYIGNESISLSAYHGISHEIFNNNGTVVSDFTINVIINNFKPSNALLVLQVYYDDGILYKTIHVPSDMIPSDGLYKYYLIAVSDEHHPAPFRVVATYKNETAIACAPVFAHP